MTEACPFCTPSDILFENEYAYVKEDAYPVSPGHLLIISKRHVKDWFTLTDTEQNAINELLRQAKSYLDETYHPDGYNIGINCGEAAGQTIFHVHMHVIPRYAGDVQNPRGGVRAVISAKQNYPAR
ncbi:MAG TPA: HIT family protein [Methanocorpusculum sp.]|nr:HIT family protein [Methanocorpusculum sp.]